MLLPVRLSVCLSHGWIDQSKRLKLGLCNFYCTVNNDNNNKGQFVRRRNMSVDITRAPYRQSGNVVRDSSTETKL